MVRLTSDPVGETTASTRTLLIEGCTILSSCSKHDQHKAGTSCVSRIGHLVGGFDARDHEEVYELLDVAGKDQLIPRVERRFGRHVWVVDTPPLHATSPRVNKSASCNARAGAEGAFRRGEAGTMRLTRINPSTALSPTAPTVFPSMLEFCSTITVIVYCTTRSRPR